MEIKKHKINLVPTVTALSLLTITVFLHDYWGIQQLVATSENQNVNVVTTIITRPNFRENLPAQVDFVNVNKLSAFKHPVTTYKNEDVKTISYKSKTVNLTPDFDLDFSKIKSGTPVYKYFNVQNGIDKYWDPSWNNEQQMYTTDNVSIENGTLNIKAKSDSNGNITSGRIDTRGIFMPTYGELDIEAKFPSGIGTFPAIWLLPQDGSYFRDHIATEYEKRSDISWRAGGEIDVAETLGAIPGEVYNVAHTYNSMTFLSIPEVGVTDLDNQSSEYHTYGLKWEPDSMTFSIDGVTTLVLNKKSDDFKDWPFDRPFYLVINLAMGGIWNNNVVGNEYPNGIDYSNQSSWMLSIKSIRHYPLAE